MAPDTIFDLASLTKVVSTTTAVMMLVEDGTNSVCAIQYHAIFRDSSDTARTGLQIGHLLTHVSGLRPDLPLGGRV